MPNKIRLAPDGASLRRSLRDGVFLLPDASTLPAGPNNMRKSLMILPRSSMACECLGTGDIELQGHAVVMRILLLGLLPGRSPQHRSLDCLHTRPCRRGCRPRHNMDTCRLRLSTDSSHFRDGRLLLLLAGEFQRRLANRRTSY